MYAPIVLFVYNRPQHTKKTIEALGKNRLATKTDLYIFSDNSKSIKDQDKVNEVREYIDCLVKTNIFNKVIIEKAEHNKGLAKSVIEGVTKVIQEYGRAIVVEDDLITSEDFIEYMNQALNFYESNQKIWSISGFSNIEITSYNEDVYLTYRGCSWGWATWSDRWEKVDWAVEDYNKFKYNPFLRRKFNRGGEDLANMLDNQMKSKIDSWAIRWCYTQSKLNMYTVYPVKSKVKNIGADGSGTHTGITDKYDKVELACHKTRLANIDLDKRINRIFKREYKLESIGQRIRNKILLIKEGKKR